MFEGFHETHVDVGEAELYVRHGGAGPPVLLLHGHPRTHATWHKVAPVLAETHSVVCPDLRGYGRSSKPPSDADHEPYSKRVMARDCVSLMRALGHERFTVVGHDRGGYVAFRTAMDHPEAVTGLVVMDMVPIGDALARCDARFAAKWWHWFFFAQDKHPAEEIINADPMRWYGGDPEQMGPEAWADYTSAIRNPETVHAMLEDYRAGLSVDQHHDAADRRQGRRLNCPTHVLWATDDDLPELYGDPRDVWREWADHVTGEPIEGSHHLAEVAPKELVSALQGFLGRSS